MSIREILKEHQKWIDTNGLKGARADLTRADLRGADLSGIDLRGAILRGASLSRADLSGALLGRADLSGADLVHATLRNASLPYVSLRHAKLNNANLRAAYLGGADLRDADLIGADLFGADLNYADLSGADLSGADLRDDGQSDLLTMADLKDIYAAHDADMSESDFQETLEQCNEQHNQRYVSFTGELLPGNTAQEYATQWAQENAREREGDLCAYLREELPDDYQMVY